MSAIVQLGPRASLLLGLLGSPMTVGELTDFIQKGRDLLDDGLVDLFDGMFDSSPRLALQALSDGGTHEIRRQLVRLEEFGLVRRAVVGVNESHLWWRA